MAPKENTRAAVEEESVGRAVFDRAFIREKLVARVDDKSVRSRLADTLTASANKDASLNPGRISRGRLSRVQGRNSTGK